MSVRAQPIPAGERREPLTVYGQTRVDLGGGSSETTYAAQGTLRGRVRALRGQEGMLARQVVGSLTYEVTVPAPLPAGVALTSASRLLWQSAAGERTLEAAEPPRPVPGPGRGYLRLLCTERESA